MAWSTSGGRFATVQVTGTSFTGATLSGVNATYAFPPDCMGAVGPTQFVVFVNGRLVTFDRRTAVHAVNPHLVHVISR